MEYQNKPETAFACSEVPTPIRLHKLIESLTDVVCALDSGGRFLYVNEASLTMWGYAPEELIGTHCSQLMVEEDRLYSVQSMELLFGGRGGFECENRYRHRNGSLVHMLWMGKFDQAEGVLYATGRNITQKKKEQEEARMLSLLARKTSNAVIATDAHQRITWVNEAFTRLTGYTLEEVTGRIPGELLQGPRTCPKVARYIRAQLSRQEPFTAEVLSYKKDGSTYWSSVHCVPVLNREGELEQFFSVESDITEQKRLQEALARETTRRQQAVTAAVIRAQEQERAQVGKELHDNVNQVLTTVKLYTELCLGHIDKSEELLQKSVQLLQATIDEIRGLSKRLSAPSLGNIRLKDSVCDLAEAVLATGRLQISLDAAAIEGLEVSADLHIAIYRILQEHLTNVLKHAGATSVQIRFVCTNGTVSFTVSDNGKGFNLADKRKGIGITNMISRAESLGGRLSLRSKPLEGCQLEVRLPL